MNGGGVRPHTPGATSALRVGLCMLFLSALTYVHQRPTGCPTALSRLDLLHALVTERVNIDPYQENTPDKATYHGHDYSDKAPGTVALALPAFVASAVGLRASGVALDSGAGWLASSWIACVGSIGVVTALGAGLLFAWLSNHVTPASALVTTLAIFLGAAPLPYATMMFSHALVAALLAVALWATARPSERGVQSAECGMTETEAERRSAGPGARRGPRGLKRWIATRRWDLLAGFACGWALASEYTAGIVIAGLFLWFGFNWVAAHRPVLPGRHAATPAHPALQLGVLRKPLHSAV